MIWRFSFFGAKELHCFVPAVENSDRSAIKNSVHTLPKIGAEREKFIYRKADRSSAWAVTCSGLLLHTGEKGRGGKGLMGPKGGPVNLQVGGRKGLIRCVEAFMSNTVLSRARVQRPTRGDGRNTYSDGAASAQWAAGFSQPLQKRQNSSHGTWKGPCELILVS